MVKVGTVLSLVGVVGLLAGAYYFIYQPAQKMFSAPAEAVGEVVGTVGEAINESFFKPAQESYSSAQKVYGSESISSLASIGTGIVSVTPLSTGLTNPIETILGFTSKKLEASKYFSVPDAVKAATPVTAFVQPKASIATVSSFAPSQISVGGKTTAGYYVPSTGTFISVSGQKTSIAPQFVQPAAKQPLLSVPSGMKKYFKNI